MSTLGFQVFPKECRIQSDATFEWNCVHFLYNLLSAGSCEHLLSVGWNSDFRNLVLQFRSTGIIGWIYFVLLLSRLTEHQVFLLNSVFEVCGLVCVLLRAGTANNDIRPCRIKLLETIDLTSFMMIWAVNLISEFWSKIVKFYLLVTFSEIYYYILCKNTTPWTFLLLGFQLYKLETW